MFDKDKKILMVVSEYTDEDGKKGISIKSQLEPEQLKEIITMINSVLHINDNIVTDEVDLTITKNNKENIHGDESLLKVDQVLSGSIVDPLKK